MFLGEEELPQLSVTADVSNTMVTVSPALSLAAGTAVPAAVVDNVNAITVYDHLHEKGLLL